jgi:phosphoglycolate phosphatase-like HAD superfamily hydrolase
LLTFFFHAAGLRSAVAAGIPTIGILSGQTAESLSAAGASYLIQDYRDLLALLSEAIEGDTLLATS